MNDRETDFVWLLERCLLMPSGTGTVIVPEDALRAVLDTLQSAKKGAPCAQCGGNYPVATKPLWKENAALKDMDSKHMPRHLYPPCDCKGCKVLRP